MSEAVIEIDGLRKSFGGQAALDGLDLRVPAGSVFGFLGRNGAGKTTTIKHLMGLVKADGGAARMFGQPVENPNAAVGIRRRVGFVTEEKDLYPYMTVEGIIRFTRRFFPGWRQDLEQHYLDLFDLPRGKSISKLSKGMRRSLRAPRSSISRSRSKRSFSNTWVTTNALVEGVDGDPMEGRLDAAHGHPLLRHHPWGGKKGAVDRTASGLGGPSGDERAVLGDRHGHAGGHRNRNGFDPTGRVGEGWRRIAALHADAASPRARLFWVRTVAGLLETGALLSLLALVAWILLPPLAGSAHDAMGSFALILSLSVAVYAISTCLAKFCDEGWRIRVSGIVVVGLFALSTSHKLPRAIDAFRPLAAESPLVTHRIPWDAVVAACVLSVLFLAAALMIIENRDY